MKMRVPLINQHEMKLTNEIPPLSILFFVTVLYSIFKALCECQCFGVSTVSSICNIFIEIIFFGLLEKMNDQEIFYKSSSGGGAHFSFLLPFLYHLLCLKSWHTICKAKKMGDIVLIFFLFQNHPT